MKKISSLIAYPLIFVLSIGFLMGQSSLENSGICNSETIEVEIFNGQLKIFNDNRTSYLLKIYSKEGLLVVYDLINKKEFNFNSNDFDSEKYFYSIKIGETHMKKGVINTIPNNHLAGS
ncbi:MAG: hypothetical protein JXQ87_00835 [Bacteroidia bacterium]